MHVFSFLNTVALVNGQELVGWDEGDDVITIKRRNDSASDKVGADGGMVVSLSADKSGEFTFKLMATSASNNYLNELLKRQEAGAATFAPITILMQDTFRQDRADGTTGYIKRAPDMTRGAVAGTQEWTIVVENLDLVFGKTPRAVA